MFPDHFLDEVRSVDLQEVVSARMTLKKVGTRWFGHCPFHADDTPSFTVSPTKGFFYCHGCHAGGDAIGFIQRFDNVTFAEAVKQLAADFGIPVPEIQVRTKQRDDVLYEVCRRAAELYHRLLPGSPSEEYFSSRGFTEETMEWWKMGHSPRSADTLRRSASDVIELMVQAGIANQRPGGQATDLLWSRAVLPVDDAAGRTISLVGRSIAQTKMGKYVNGKESRIFRKGSVLFGLGLADRAIREEGHALMVEGQLDVVTLHQAGLKQAVAGMGTAFTQEHARLISRRAKKVMLAFDSDKAGRKAAYDACVVALEAGLEVNVVKLPEGMDPDDLVGKQGPDAMRALQEEAADGVEYIVETLVGTGAAKTSQERSRIGKAGAKVLSRIKDEVTRGMALDLLSEKLKIQERLLAEQSQRVREERMQVKVGGQRFRAHGFLPSELLLLGLVLRSPEGCAEFKKIPDRALARYLKSAPILERVAKSTGWVSVGLLLNELSQIEMKQCVQEAAALPESVLSCVQVQACWKGLKDELNETRSEDLRAALQSALERDDYDEASSLQEALLRLARRK